MVDTGFVDATNKLVLMGFPPIKTVHEVETATNMYPGRIVQEGSTAYDIVVGTGAQVAPKGFLGYEDSSPEFRPANMSTAYAATDMATVIRGGGFVMDAPLSPYATAVRGDVMFSWAAGTVYPGRMMGGMPAIKIPFSKQTSEYDTGVDIPSGVAVRGCLVNVTTGTASGTIDVGILSTESGGDADGFLDALSCATTGTWPVPAAIDATDSNNTLGALLFETTTKSADGTALYARITPAGPFGWIGDGTATSVSFTTSSHTIAGNIYVLVDGKGIVPMGIAEESVTTTTTAGRIHMRATF